MFICVYMPLYMSMCVYACVCQKERESNHVKHMLFAYDIIDNLSMACQLLHISKDNFNTYTHLLQV